MGCSPRRNSDVADRHFVRRPGASGPWTNPEPELRTSAGGGRIAGLVGLGTALVLACGAPIIDRMGPIRALQAGALLAALSLGVAGTGSAMLLLLLASALGVAAGFTTPAWIGIALAEAVRLAPPDRIAAVTARAALFVLMTAAVAPPCFALLVTATGGWTLPSVVVAGQAILCTFAVARDFPERTPHAPGSR